MALAPSTMVPDRQPSPGLSLNLSSNNPFRNRTTSPLPSPRSADAQTTKFPMSSKNPFLDASEFPADPAGPPGASSSRNARNNTAALPADLFNDLSLLDRPITNVAPPPPPPRMGPPPRSGTLPMQGHRPTGPDERRDRPRVPPRGPLSPGKRDGRPRRASESSVMEGERRPREDRDRERSDRPRRTESEERKRRERRREREERNRREKDKAATSAPGGRGLKKPQGLDIIDKLDVTGIYGQGLFHHDGPFDACNPHRNAKKHRHAPMQAFPAGSANMALGGSGPLRTKLDLDKFHGRGEEGFSEYAATRKAATTVVDPTQRAEQVHGEETYGLGTSTFLEGAPASKSALQRRDSEDPTDVAMPGPGLARKKSLVQRFRGMSGSRRNGPGDFRSPEARYQYGNERENSPPQNKASSAGGPGRARYTKENEVNLFDNDYEAAFDKKGAQIRIQEQERPTAGDSRAPTSPPAVGLVRARTTDVDGPVRGSSNEEERATGGGGGFLNRMRSLKGGRRPRNGS